MQAEVELFRYARELAKEEGMTPARVDELCIQKSQPTVVPSLRPSLRTAHTRLFRSS